jgi:ShK domain-like
VTVLERVQIAHTLRPEQERTMKTPRLQSWLCLVLIAVTTTPSDASAKNVDALASTLDKIASRIPQRVRFWRKNVPSEHTSSTMHVPSQDISVSMVDDAAVADEGVKSDDIVDCSKDRTCETGGLYDGDEGENEEEHVRTSTVDVGVGHKIVELDDIVDTDDLHDEDEEDGDYEEEWDEMEDEEGCFDNDEKCDEWASMGECEANPKYMLTYCKQSCMICGDV